MTDDDKRWLDDGVRFGWEMPYATWWKRLLVIRRIRAAWHSYQVDRHNAFWSSFGQIPSGYDSWVIYGIARGFERKDKP